MKFLIDNALFVEAILFVLLFAALVVICILSRKLQKLKHSKSKKGSSSGSVPKEKHKEILEERNSSRSKYEKKVKEYDQLNKENIKTKNNYNQMRDDLGEASLEITNLKRKIDALNRKNDELARENAELNKLVGNEPEPIVEVDTPKNDSTMYASFPRSAGSSVYFSDLTENLADDSYFEIKISNTSGKATFKPLDFMKIRSFDVAWNAMISEGVKPAAATSVCGIEPGKAHKEGNDLIVDNPAKIKLA